MNYTEYLNKVGLVVNTLLTPFTTKSYGAYGSRVFEGTNGIKSVVLHTTGNPSATAKNEATNIHNNKPNSTGQSFHAVADEHGVYECVKFSHSAYHSGDKATNLTSLGFELSDNSPEKGYDNFIKYVAWAMYQEGIIPSESTVKFHNEIVSTSCGSFLRNKGKATIIEDLNKYIAIAKGGASEKPSKPNVDVDGFYKVGTLVEFSTLYENHHLNKISNLPYVNKLDRGFGYVAKVYPKDNNPYVITETKGGKVIGAIRPVNVYRKDDKNILEGKGKPSQPNKPVDTSFKEGDMVTCNASKDIYHTQLDKSMFNGKNKFKVMQIGRMGNPNHVLLAGVMTWVERSTCKKG